MKLTQIKPIYALLIGNLLGLLVLLISDTIFVLSQNKDFDFVGWVLWVVFVIAVLPTSYLAFNFKNKLIKGFMAILWTLFWAVLCSIVVLFYHTYILKAPL